MKNNRYAFCSADAPEALDTLIAKGGPGALFTMKNVAFAANFTCSCGKTATFYIVEQERTDDDRS